MIALHNLLVIEFCDAKHCASDTAPPLSWLRIAPLPSIPVAFRSKLSTLNCHSSLIARSSRTTRPGRSRGTIRHEPCLGRHFTDDKSILAIDGFFASLWKRHTTMVRVSASARFKVAAMLMRGVQM